MSNKNTKNRQHPFIERLNDELAVNNGRTKELSSQQLWIAQCLLNKQIGKMRWPPGKFQIDIDRVQDSMPALWGRAFRDGAIRGLKRIGARVVKLDKGVVLELRGVNLSRRRFLKQLKIELDWPEQP